MKYTFIYDSISFLLSLLVICYCLYTFDPVAIIGGFFAVFVPICVKLLTSSTPFPSIFKRPDGAADCNLFNTGGKCENESGFPSGHVTLISYFCFYIYSRYSRNIQDYIFGTDDDAVEVGGDDHGHEEAIVKVVCILPIILMGFARYMKNCHNIIQIIAGCATGYGISMFMK
tara:strand:+ start:611 stop:1126 length:516 start_codon:yes stop_codon:yes gene_type:complete